MSYAQIAVDAKKLAWILGVEEIPMGLLDRQEFRIAARVLTDSYQCGTSVEALTNAVAWIQHATAIGRAMGQAETDKAWEKRIRGIFGIRPGLGDLT